MKKTNETIAKAGAVGKLSHTTLTALVIAIIIVANAVIYAIVQLFGLYLYTPEKKDLTLTGISEELFAEAEEDGKKITITFFSQESSLKASSTGNQVYITANYFKQKHPTLIDIRYVNVLTKLDQDGKIVSDMDKYTEDMNGNKTIVDAHTVVFECGENYRVTSDGVSQEGFAQFFTFDADGYETSYNGEEVMTAMMCWVLSDEHKTAYFTKNHGETADYALSNLLACAGYTVNQIDLRKEELPEDCSLLFISSPTSDFEKARADSNVRTEIETEIERIETYLEQGGALYVSLDPGVKTLPILEGFLSEHGIAYSTTVTKDGRSVHNYVRDSANSVSVSDYTLMAEYASGTLPSAIRSTVEKYSDGAVVLESVAALELSGKASALLLSSSDAQLYADGKVVSDSGSYCVAAVSELDSGAKIFVIPSIYLTSSGALVSGYANRTFMYALFDNLYGAENMPYGCNMALYNTQILENLSGEMRRVYTVLIMAVPVALALTGVIVTVRRKNR